MTLTTKRFIAALAVFAGLAAGSLPAQADDGQKLGRFGAWDAYVRTTDGNKECFMVSVPSARAERLSRGDIYAWIIHRPAENVTGEVLISLGYPHKADSAVKVEIGDKQWNFDAERDSSSANSDSDIAFTPDSSQERAIVDAIKNGSTMVVKGVSQRGNNTRDTYSLSGTTAAYQAISNACGVN
jgi:hypothetical protein